MNNYFIIAHRGESFEAPENTLSSINLAWANGSDAVEIDIRLTKDNRIVVIHDAHTMRVAKEKMWVRSSMLIDLKNLDVGKYKGDKYEEEKIPELYEVLKTVPTDKKILIEIKCGKEIIPVLTETLKDSELHVEQIEIISFKLPVLIEIRKKLPQYSVLWILSLDYHKIFRIFNPSIKKIITKAIKNKITGIDLRDGRFLTKENILKIKSANLKLYVWTVNNFNRVKVLFDYGVDGITTDRAGWIKSKLNS